MMIGSVFISQQSLLPEMTTHCSSSFTVSAFTLTTFRQGRHHSDYFPPMLLEKTNLRQHRGIVHDVSSKSACFMTRENTKSPLTSANEDLESSSSSSLIMDNVAEDYESHSQAWKDAMALKKRAERERLEAERMTTALLLDKIASLEKQLEKLSEKHDGVASSREEARVLQKEQDIRQQIALLKGQLEPSKPSATITSIKSDNVEEKVGFSSKDAAVPSMPSDLKQKRIKAYRSFSPVVQSLFARAAKVENIEDAEEVIEKCYILEQKRMQDGNTAPMDILDIANAQAGYETLPPPIQFMIKESLDMKSCRNNTEIMEALILKKKVKRTSDGGVEFSMDDPDLDNDEKEGGRSSSGSGSGSSSKRGKMREFTKQEKEEALTLYESLPSAMKVMLAQSVGEVNENNSTAIVARPKLRRKIVACRGWSRICSIWK
jgi:hypothetical protein